MSAHARLSPSAASRWSHCTASVRAIERAIEAGVVPADQSNDAADEGTAAHEIRAECLQLGLEPHDLIGTTVHVNGKDWPVTEEMADYLQPGIDWCLERAAGGTMIETRVKLDPWLSGQFGTVDFASVLRTEERFALVLSDLKYGFLPVEAERNPQQMIYALGVLTTTLGEYPVRWPDEIIIAIDQPRKGGIKVWACTKEELLEFGAWIAERGKEVLSDQAVFRPSDKACHYCPLNEPGLCAARDGWILDMAGLDDLDDLGEPPDPREITPERRGNLVRHQKVVADWFAALGRQSFAAAMHGEPDPGTKLVLGDQGDRKWGDEDAAEALLTGALGDDAWAPRKIVSPAQAEKVLKPGRKRPGNPEAWEALTALVTRAEATPKLAPAEDPKPAFNPVENMVADLDDL